MIWMKNALTAGNNEDLLSSIGWQYKEVSGRTRVYNEGQACNAGHSPRAAVQHIKVSVMQWARRTKKGVVWETDLFRGKFSTCPVRTCEVWGICDEVTLVKDLDV